MGVTDNGDLGGTASSLAATTHLKRYTIIWQGQRSHTSMALWGATSSAVAAPSPV